MHNLMVLFTVLPVAAALAAPADLYVAPTGDDTAPGTAAAPLRTLAGARDALRAQRPEGGAVVHVAAGIYALDSPLEFTAEDSGTAAAPIIYRADGEVRLRGGKTVPDWRPVTDPALLAKLEPNARGQVLAADLKALGIADFGSPGGGGLEVFFDDQPMTLSRWPNEGFVKIVEEAGSVPFDVRGRKGNKEGKFIYDGDRPSRWLDEKDAWLHGYWFWDWSDQRQKIQTIDPAAKRIDLVPPDHSYGYRKGQWYYAFNLFSEIDQPGEWYVDREEGILYFWPPKPIDQAETMISVIPSLVTLTDVSHLTLRGFTFEAARATGLSIRGGESNRVIGCTFRNLGQHGVSVTGGRDHGVIGCDLTLLGDSGINLSGGDRKTLTPAGHFADNNRIHGYGRIKRMYSRGIGLDGVGQRATHNLIYDAPHQAMSFGGNDHRIEFNEIHSVCYESNDAGAIYSGRDWTMRGTMIRHNYLHHINGYEGRGCVGVYLDDMYSGTDIVANVFYKVTRAAFIGGGRDCAVIGNLFVDCRPALHIDARAMGWAAGSVDTTMTTRLKAMPVDQPPWRDRWPELLTILEDEPAAPKGNVVRANVSVGGRWDEIEGKAPPYLTIENNLVDEDPGFVGEPPENFRLKPDSPAFALGYEPIPFERIGLYQDEQRAS